MALHELPRDRGDECGHGSSQGPDQCAQAPSDCHGSTFFAAPALLGDRPTRRFYETGLGFRAAVLRRFCRNTPRLTFFIERSPRPWRCGRSPSSPRNCRNNARIRARELKPPFHGCACLAAATQLHKGDCPRRKCQAEQFDTRVLGGEQGGNLLVEPLGGLWRQTGGRINVRLARLGANGWRSVLAVRLAAELDCGV